MRPEGSLSMSIRSSVTGQGIGGPDGPARLYDTGRLDQAHGDQKRNGVRMHPVVPLVLLCVPAVAEIVGCYLPYLWLKDRAPLVVLLPSAASLALFVWLLSLHPVAAGRTYAAYGGVYVATALLLRPPAAGGAPATWGISGVGGCRAR